MKKLTIIVLTLLAIVFINEKCYGDDSTSVGVVKSTTNVVKSTAKKLVITDWIKDKTLKYGYLGSLCGAQFFTGVTEGYHFNGNKGYLAQENNYHIYTTLNRTSWVSTGFFFQANIRDKKQSWFNKGRRVIGGILISRLFFESAYKWQRYNNPFENDPNRNQHAIVYFGIRDGMITDLYIGTGMVTTPLADLLILLTGVWIFK